MIDLKRVYFGCSDADTEAERYPNQFKQVFFDPHDYLEELINGDRYIMIGRKGAGKTAYKAQIQLVADEKNIYSYQRSLDNFNNLTFEQIKTFDALGGNPYISFWKCVLLIECVKMLNQYEPNIQKDSFIEIFDSLQRHGFIERDNNIDMTISKLVETDSTISVHSLFSHGRKNTIERKIVGAEQIYSSILQSIKDLYLKKKFVFVIDGLDDILINKEYKSEIITGLIRATEIINKVFKNTTLKIKVIILIRNDMLLLCRDPNISKIESDSGINLSWGDMDDPFDSDLIRLVSRRIDVVSGEENSFVKVCKDIFPDSIGNKDSIDYILDNIIYRPRDILQLFTVAQDKFRYGRQFTPENIQNILKIYSSQYFLKAMKDELTGFFPDSVVTALPSVLSKMGTQYFYLSDFKKELENHREFAETSAKAILEKLFADGYIGQHRPRDDSDFTVFSYRNLHEQFEEQHECILHRGLMRALSIY